MDSAVMTRGQNQWSWEWVSWIHTIWTAIKKTVKKTWPEPQRSVKQQKIQYHIMDLQEEEKENWTEKKICRK